MWHEDKLECWDQVEVFRYSLSKLEWLTCQLKSNKRELEKMCLNFVASYATGSNVSAYINMVCETLRNTIPKAVVFCQVREARKSLLNQFYSQIGRREVKYFYVYITDVEFRSASLKIMAPWYFYVTKCHTICECAEGGTGENARWGSRSHGKERDHSQKTWAIQVSQRWDWCSCLEMMNPIFHAEKIYRLSGKKQFSYFRIEYK